MRAFRNETLCADLVNEVLRLLQQAQAKQADTMKSLTLHDLYQQAIKNGEILADPHQAALIDALTPVFDAFSASKTTITETDEKKSFFSRFLSAVGQADVPEAEALIKGVYIWGGVGRGKTFIVDFFFKHLPTEQKQRTHFHSFMKSVHDQIRDLGNVEEPLEKIAKQIAAKTRILCLDEMHVNDITDAMLLGGLFEHLFKDGVTLITTANIPPAGLYKDGLQRKRFLPAIALLEKHTELINADGEMDYRMRALEQADVYQIGTGELVEKRLENYFTAMVGINAELEYEAIEVNGRSIPIKQAYKGVAWFEFKDLCMSARSTLDYIELATRFNTILISNIPVMGTLQDDAARRFVNLIDELYDRGVNVVISAEATPTELYTGKRMTFEFDRTISRLMEIRSKEYLTAEHDPRSEHEES
ncbi:cell division protein ZapE [Leucothrix arctica]|uniref:Cell division protein ZapE n=2 Tax=Leucothrix arctica TaxID=1481894 RepID=A0A317CE12_9GAMM|nr:cell division protein ZapE [Leucothrix arctica]